jgi:hypothetical protein
LVPAAGSASAVDPTATAATAITAAAITAARPRRRGAEVIKRSFPQGQLEYSFQYSLEN